MSVESSPTVRIAERYSLRERIAVGGMGEVHLATDDRLGRLVAVKVLAAGFADSPDFVERFRREALTAAALSHPNIAQVYDYGVDGDSHFIVMEYAEGQDLAHVIREHGRLTPGDAVRVAEQVCAALGAAHRAGVVHRDVKPGNVIIRPDGTVKVTDFGIARALGQASLTDTGTVMGTAAYVAPEQARGEATTPSSDLYSLGILLFQMLTGSVPFDGDTPVAIAMRHLDEPVPLPSSRVADLPANLDEVVVRATAKSPADRYADADAMAAALIGHEMRADAATRALPAGEATSVLDLASDSTAASTAMMPTVGMPSSGERTVVTPVPAAPDAPVAAAAPTAPTTPAPAVTRRSSAASRRRSGPSPLVWVLLVAVVALVGILGYVLLSGSDAPATTAPGTRPSATSEKPTPAPSTTAPPSDGSTVPGGLVGQQRDAAVNELIGLGVNVRWVLVRSTQPDGAVMGSYPAEGQPMTKGQTVALVVSRGHAPDRVNSSFVVPDGLVGTSAKDAEKSLGGEDVRVTRVTVPSDGDSGQVLATWPSAGTRTADGIVVLVVSGDAKGGSSDGDG
ncbi:Stk1 family PASTA domain-containing Ser/Thr kinase [Terracoccus sp. 273MFTsu3.1]|uniref:Stk1 family PASTA domain-containing Ser/Thr kinase n=1 Tax=Terracoccus sp. 273MFTsu3.1 TaxID=1172188 RepID=UPI0003801434|nr:Stk1 family PASTA domain-containing Ser/Thr kinase [Terracoccus sp. 273MFTsu3.1]